MSLFDLTGKSVLITGSSKGIGKSIATRYAEHGAKVIISSRTSETCIDTADEINTSIGKELAYPIPCNISHQEELEDLVSKTREIIGKIDVLVCNAATNTHMGSMLDMPIEAFDKVMNNNIRSNQILSNLVIPEMVERNDGAIIIVSSIAALRGSSLATKKRNADLAETLRREPRPRPMRRSSIRKRRRGQQSCRRHRCPQWRRRARATCGLKCATLPALPAR